MGFFDELIGHPEHMFMKTDEQVRQEQNDDAYKAGQEAGKSLLGDVFTPVPHAGEPILAFGEEAKAAKERSNELREIFQSGVDNSRKNGW